MERYRQNIRLRAREQTNGFLAEHYLAEQHTGGTWLTDVLLFFFTISLGLGLLAVSLWPLMTTPGVLGFLAGIVATFLVSGLLMLWVFLRSGRREEHR